MFITVLTYKTRKTSDIHAISTGKAKISWIHIQDSMEVRDFSNHQSSIRLLAISSTLMTVGHTAKTSCTVANVKHVKTVSSATDLFLNSIASSTSSIVERNMKNLFPRLSLTCRNLESGESFFLLIFHHLDTTKQQRRSIFQ